MGYSWKSGTPNGKAVAENTTPALGQVVAADGPTEAFSYSLHGGDSKYFQIDDYGNLSLRSALNYESRSNNLYSVEIRAYNDSGARLLTRKFVMTLQNQDEFETGWQRNGDPSGRTLNENTNAGVQLADFGATDGDRGVDVVYSIPSTDVNYFNINSSNGRLYLAQRLDYESSAGQAINNRYSVVVTATSGDGSDPITSLYILTLVNVNEANLDDVSASWSRRSSGRNLNENVDGRIADFVAKDSDGGAISYWLSQTPDGNDTGLFSLDGNGRLYVKQEFDFDTDAAIARDNRYTVVVNAMGLDGGESVGDGQLSITQLYILTITNIDRRLSWEINDVDRSGATLQETNAAGISVADFNAVNEGGDAAVTYGLANRQHDKYFEIDSATGVLSTASIFDFEDPANRNNRYTVRVQASAVDDSYRLEQDFVLTISNDNGEVRFTDAPRGATLAENNAANVSVADFEGTDTDGALVNYNLEGDDAKYFAINNLAGNLRGLLTVKSVLDYEDDEHGRRYSVIVKVDSTDANDNSVVTSLFILTVTNVDSKPSWDAGGNLSGATLEENDADGAIFTTFQASSGDTDATVTYSIRPNHADDDKFTINKTTGEFTTGSGVVFDSEDSSVIRHNHRYTVQVRAQADDGTASIAQTFILTITNVDEFDAVWTNLPTGDDINENDAVAGRRIGEYLATEGDAGTTIVYSLDPSNDENYFSIETRSNGKVRLYLKSNLDYEDTNHADGLYSVILRADPDDDSGRTTQLFVLTLNNREEKTGWENDGDPRGNQISEGNATGLSVADFGATDGDVTVTYSLRDGHGHDGYFAIDATTGVLTVLSAFDYENADNNNNRYTVQVYANSTDDSSSINRTFVLSIDNINDGATTWDVKPASGSIAENSSANARVASFRAVDEDGSGIEYSLSGADASSFRIDSSGRLYATESFDHETKNSYDVDVHATGTNGGTGVGTGAVTLTQSFNLTVTDRAEKTGWENDGNPRGNQISEGNATGVSVADFGATDGDVTVTYSLRDGHGHDGYFAIDATTGVLTVLSAFDYENADNNNNRYTVQVYANSTDDSSSINRTFVLSIDNINDGATTWDVKPASGSIAENSSANARVASFRAVDEDGSGIEYSLSGADASSFRIDSSGRLYATESFDHETKNSYDVDVHATGTNGGTGVGTGAVTLTQSFNLTVTDRAEKTGWENDGNPRGNQISEGNATGVSVADFGATDGDVTVTYSLRDGHGHDGYFAIDATTGVLTVLSAFDYENADNNNNRYTVQVYANSTDDSSSINRTFVLSIDNINDGATTWDVKPASGSIAENSSANARVASFRAVDEDGSGIEYSLSGADASSFRIDSSGRLYATESFDHETKNSYDVDVHATGTNGGTGVGTGAVTLTQSFNLTVTDRNESIEWTSTAEGNTKAENIASGTSLADFAAADPDAADTSTITYGLRTNHNQDKYFEIDSTTGVLTTASELDFESRERYTVVVRARADDGSASINETFILTVTNVNDNETDWRDGGGYNESGRTLNENNNEGTRIAEFRATDGDKVDIDYSLTGTDAAYFSIEDRSGGVGRLYLKSSLDYEDSSHAATLYSVVVVADSVDASASISQLYVLTLNNQNESDSNDVSATWHRRSDGTGRNENEDPRQLTQFEARDADGSGISYWLSGDAADVAKFSIDSSGRLYTTQTFDHESTDGQAKDNRYSVVVNAYGTGGGTEIGDGALSLTHTFILTINNVNESDINDVGATWRSRSGGTSRNENEDPRQLTQFEARDADGPGISYWLSGDNMDKFSIDIVGKLYTTQTFDHESTEGRNKNQRYSVVVNALGTAGDNVEQTGDGAVAVTQTYILTIRNRDEFSTNWPNSGHPDGNTKAENISIGTSLGDFSATDGDGFTVTYGLRGRYRDDSYFQINKDTGILSVRKEFDFESKDHYTVEVRARAVDGSSSINETFILTITNIDDNETEWVRGGNPSGRALNENNAAGTRLAEFRAIDNDEGVTIDYSLQAGGDSAYFSLDEVNGRARLHLVSSLDFEDASHTIPIYSVVVVASSSDASADISQLYVLSVGNRGESTTWQSDGNPDGAVVVENNTAGTTISLADFGAIDGDGATVTYSLRARHRDDKYFEIDKDTGVLTTNSVFDHEERNRYTVEVRARADDGGSAINETFILTIGNVNEETTDWRDGSGYNTSGRSLAENNSIGSEVAKFRATDGDKVDVTYSLTGEDAAYFSIDSRSGGEGRLHLKSRLDFEDSNHTSPIYNVVINANSTDDSAAISQLYVLSLTDQGEGIGWAADDATDGGSPSGGNISENNAIGASVADFGAIDLDGDANVTITYGLRTRHRDDKYFAIDKDTGVLTLTSHLDFENPANDNNQYTVVVRAKSTDGGNRIEETFVLTVEDIGQSPAFWVGDQPAGASIAENNSANARVASFRADDEGGGIVYSLSGADAVYFSIDTASGVLAVESRLNFEDSSHADGLYSVTLIALPDDGGTNISQLFILTVTDRNESIEWTSTPEGAILAENIVSGTSLANFAAADPDAADTPTVTYGLSGRDAKYFAIDSTSGELTTASVLDFESKERYTVSVRARADDGSASINETFILTITNLDDATTWRDGDYRGGTYNQDGRELNENNSIGSEIARFRATDGDKNVDIDYSLSSGGDSAYFRIDSRSGGEGRLYAVSSFDFEDTSHTKMDSGNVVNNTIYSVVVNASSSDASTDISQLYILTLIDREERVEWQANGNPDGSTQSENFAVGTSLADFNAADPDALKSGETAPNVTYGLLNSRHDDYFSINTETGVLTTISAFDFDDPANSNNRYTVIVRASAEGDNHRIEETFVLTVTNLNDNDITWEKSPPIYDDGKGIIMENNNPRTALDTFQADDEDSGATVNYSFDTTATDYKYFSIDANNGKLYAISVFDFEDASHDNSYHIRVVATSTDGSTSITQDYRISVGDGPDAAQWEANGNPNGKAVAENITTATEVANFNAIDPDAGSNGVSYYLRTNYRHDKYFEIDSTGSLTTKSEFDFENPGNGNNRYTVVVRAVATDGGSTLGQTFILTITDANDAPTWVTQRQPLDNQNYTPDGTARLLIIDEGVIGSDAGATAGTQVGKFKASDQDGDAVTYSLVDSLDDDYFSIDSNGRLFLKSTLNFEDTNHTADLYSVVVKVDAGSDTITSLFVISVTDANDPAAWTQNPSGATIAEGPALGAADPSDRVADFDYEDPDAGANSSAIVHSLSGRDAQYFSIGSTTGHLFVVSSFDYEDSAVINRNHRYTVVVSVDDANASNNAAAITQLFVLTISNLDEFATGWVDNGNPSTITISENNAIGITVADFNATDGDYGIAVTYSLSGTDAAYFNINAATGALTLASSFNYEDSHAATYNVVINAKSTDGSAISQAYALNVTDVDDGNKWTTTPAGFALDENNTIGVELGTFEAESIIDPNLTISYSLKFGNDHTYFSINADSGVLSIRSSLDYESQTHYSVIVQADTPDATNITISELFILSVGDVNDNPVTWLLDGNPSGIEINEVTSSPSNNFFGAAGYSLADFNAMDADSGATISYSLATLNDFVIDSTTGVLRVRPDMAGNGALDYESLSEIPNGKARVSLVVNAHSSDGSDTISQLFVITIIDQVEPPQWGTRLGEQTISSGFFIYENNAINDNIPANNLFVNTNEVTYEIKSGKDGAYFNVTGSGAFAFLSAKSVFDYEGSEDRNHRYSVTLRAFNTSGEIFADYVLTIRDVNTDITWSNDTDYGKGNPSGGSIDEVITGGTSNAGTNLANFDIDGERVTSRHRRDIPAGLNIEYTLTGDDAAYFSINADDGRLYTKSDFDFEDTTHTGILYSVIINATASVDAPETHADKTISRVYVLTINDINGGGLAPDAPTPDQPVGWNGKILFDGDTDQIGGIFDGIGNDGLVIIGNDLVATQYDSVSATNTDLVLNNIENFADSFVGYTDADGNDQNHWFFVRDDAEDNTGHIVFDADGLDVNLESLSQGGATTTPDQINLLAGLNFGSDGDFNKPDDLTLDLNGNNAASLTHDQFLALIGGSNNIDFI